VPEIAAHVVAVPTLLTTREDIAAQVERLEIHHLASPEGDLTSPCSRLGSTANTEHADGDAELVAFAREGIEDLKPTLRPGPPGALVSVAAPETRLERQRRRWIGWERKRGKLHELNRLLRGATDTTFMDFGPAQRRRLRTSDTSSRWIRTRDCPRHGQAVDRQDGASAQSAAASTPSAAGS